jgi:hypothetical protein
MAAIAPATEPRSTSLPLIPPEEKFWQRYSPHSEAPLSGVTSGVIHALAIGLLLLIIYIKYMTGIEEENRSLPVDVVRFTGGGGGTPGAKVGGTGGSETGDTDGSDSNPDRPMGPEPPRLPELAPAKAEGIKQEFNNDPTADWYSKHGSTPSTVLFDLEKGARDTLRKSVNPGAGGGGGGMGGSGQDGGRDSGKDKGMGGGTGPGNGGGVITVREKRVLRWAMTFNTRDGRDYLAQLTGLGAKIGIPIEGKEGKFLLIDDLRNPTVAVEKDVSKLNLIYWIDSKPESVQSLFSVIPHHQPSQPSYFVAFFPKKIEDRLLDLEMDFASRRYNGLKDENRIHETKFDVIRSGAAYDVRVNMVYLKRKEP